MPAAQVRFLYVSLHSLPQSAGNGTMDLLSFTASLLTVIHAARMGKKSVHKLNACHKAPKELD